MAKDRSLNAFREINCFSLQEWYETLQKEAAVNVKADARYRHHWTSNH
jgi:hypothetical protein